MILDEVNKRGGRFLIKDKPSDPWKEVSKSKALRKISRLLKKQEKENKIPSEEPSLMNALRLDSTGSKQTKVSILKTEESAGQKQEASSSYAAETNVPTGNVSGNMPGSPSHHEQDVGLFPFDESFTKMDADDWFLDSSGSMASTLLGPDDTSEAMGAKDEEDYWKQLSSGTTGANLAKYHRHDDMLTTERDNHMTRTSGCSNETMFQKSEPMDQNDIVDDDTIRSLGFKPMSRNSSQHSSRNLLRGSNTSNRDLSASLTSSERSNARSLMSGSSFGMSISMGRSNGSYADMYTRTSSLDTFSMSMSIPSATLSTNGAEKHLDGPSLYRLVTSSEKPSVSSTHDKEFSELADQVSEVSNAESDISSITFQTPRYAHQTERVRGGRRAVGRQISALRMPDDTVIRTSDMTDVDENHSSLRMGSRMGAIADDHSALTMGTEMDVCKLLDRMKSEPEDALLQTRCFGELAGIAWDHMVDDVSKEVVDSMQDLISIMNKHRHDAQVQSQSCMAFGWLASNNATLKRFIAFFGGVEAIVRGLTDCEEDELVQAHGCNALGSLACNDGPNQQKVAFEGGIKVVVRAMEENPGSVDVQKYGCRALSNVAKGNAANTISVANDNGVAAIAMAMRMHIDSDEVQINGIWALGTLSSHITTVRASVAKVGGIGSILSGMRHHAGSEEVQASGCLSLQHLAVEKHLDSFLDAKGAEIILAAMNSFDSNSTIQMIGCVLVGKIAASSVDAQEAATFAGGIKTVLRVAQRTWTDLNVNNEARIALGRLAKNNNIAQKRIAQTVVRAMRAALQDADIQANCCCTLETVAKQDSESRQWIMAAGGVEAIRAARLNHPNKDDIWTMTLASLASHEMAEEFVTEAVEEILAIVATMEVNGDEEHEQERSCRRLVKLLSSNSHQPYVGGTFVSADGMIALIRAMDLYQENLRLQGNGCASLYMLCVDNIEGRAHFIRQGGAQVLVITMYNWPTRESVQIFGCKILELLVKESSRSRRDVYKAGACRVLHDAVALFPKNSGLIKAANNALSLLVREVGMGVISQGNHSGFRAGSNAVVPPV